jgi:hypothetical protein
MTPDYFSQYANFFVLERSPSGFSRCASTPTEDP